MSPPPDSTLADPQQVIADLRRELSECTAQRDEALAERDKALQRVAERTAELDAALQQQTATADVLRVINSSAGDLTPVFEVILEKATRLCKASFGISWRYDRDAERYEPIVTRGVPAAFADFLCTDYTPTPATAQHVLSDAPFIHVLDEAETDGYRTGESQFRRAMVDLGGARTSLAVQLQRDDTALSIHRQEVCAFSEKEIALLQNFAAHAVIAMENARLLGELRQRTEQVAKLNRGLEARVAEQVEELKRVGRLKRFLAPQLAELIVSQGDEKILESHRREIVVVFCDLRGYTAFTETAELEEVLEFLRLYHGALGPLVSHRSGSFTK